jgi:DEAD/DEAH box helicase
MVLSFVVIKRPGLFVYLFSLVSTSKAFVPAAVVSCHTPRLFSAATAATTVTTFGAITPPALDEIIIEKEKRTKKKKMQDAVTYPEFSSLSDLHPILRSNVAAMGFTSMTEIQAKTWEAAIAGQDVLGRARTGTGKTVSFLLPAIQQLLVHNDNRKKNEIEILILSPTRELAAQIDDQADALLKNIKTMSHQVVFGGASKPKDIAAFNRRLPTILTATPGRLRDHLQTTQLSSGAKFGQCLKNVKILVLDETDRCVFILFKTMILGLNLLYRENSGCTLDFFLISQVVLFFLSV